MEKNSMYITDILKIGLILDEDYDHAQALVSKKKGQQPCGYDIERDYINSKSYHDKFLFLPASPNVQERIYQETGRLLEFVDSLPAEQKCEERLLALGRRTGNLLVDNFNRPGKELCTGFNEEERAKIEKCDESIILIHNHSMNGLPSGQDLLSYLHYDRVLLSIVACHDGHLYSIEYVSKEFEPLYQEVLESYQKRGNDIPTAKRLAMTAIYRLNEQYSSRHKLFIIQSL